MGRSSSAQRQRYSKNYRNARASALATIKLESGCVDCGYKDHPEALEFDHVRGQKLFSIGKNIMTFGFTILLDEVEKCEIRCANCHAIKTHKDRLEVDNG